MILKSKVEGSDSRSSSSTAKGSNGVAEIMGLTSRADFSLIDCRFAFGDVVRYCGCMVVALSEEVLVVRENVRLVGDFAAEEVRGLRGEDCSGGMSVEFLGEGP